MTFCFCDILMNTYFIDFVTGDVNKNETDKKDTDRDSNNWYEWEL